MKNAKRKPARAAAKPSRHLEAVRRHRANMRKQGMKLVQIWVPDTDAPGFQAELRRQLTEIARAAADPSSDEAAVNRELGEWAELMEEDLDRMEKGGGK